MFFVFPKILLSAQRSLITIVDFTMAATAQTNAGNMLQILLRTWTSLNRFPSWNTLLDVGSVVQKAGKGMLC